MTISIRSAALAAAFAATVALTFTATSFSGQTSELTRAETCGQAAWPNIPAACLDGAAPATVRYVSADPAPADRKVAEQFVTAFQ